jgi:hypothetical protein
VNYRILIAGVPDRDSVVAEIWVRKERFAEVHQDRDALRVEIYCSRSGTAWDIAYDDLIHLLAAARHKLAGPMS